MYAEQSRAAVLMVLLAIALVGVLAAILAIVFTAPNRGGALGTYTIPLGSSGGAASGGSGSFSPGGGGGAAAIQTGGGTSAQGYRICTTTELQIFVVWTFSNANVAVRNNNSGCEAQAVTVLVNNSYRCSVGDLEPGGVRNISSGSCVGGGGDAFDSRTQSISSCAVEITNPSGRFACTSL